MTATDDRFGCPLPGWTPPPVPGWTVQQGRWARLERLDPGRHCAALFAANRASGAIWDYLPYGPFADPARYRDWLDRAATEALYLKMRWAFGAGYRRLEWTCDALNPASRRAAGRLGLSYEGVFRQAAVVKARKRDTAWFAGIDAAWPALRAAFDAWLDPANFDSAGRQRRSLSGLTRPLLAARDPLLAAG
jgi:hypothetical protein